MNPQEAFLQAILANPDDDAPRLMYADWLTERGNPCGEFIRLQCRLATLPSDDPLRPDLEARERALLQQHEIEWLAPIRNLVKSVRWRRGFIEKITISALDLLEHGVTIFRLAPVTSLRLFDVSKVPLLRSAELGEVIRKFELKPTGSSTFNWRRLRTGSVAGPPADS